MDTGWRAGLARALSSGINALLRRLLVIHVGDVDTARERYGQMELWKRLWIWW